MKSHIVQSVLNLGTRWERVVNFTPQPPYPEKEPRYPFNKRVGGCRAGLVDKGKMKITCLYRVPNPGPSMSQPSSYNDSTM